ncbi:MAG: NAD(P)-dependent glycerol-3-phosphate dehydrogenase [Chloroflexi bacterium]|nr:NAD(P)-dependent glycerol-3-phosphate dehydrogenase [Chloroflexota bacterium]MCH8297758.1 NAD(P)-dependent glycerol-3-phosphate dehydrogenase [Chloroflexota bacterium]MCH8892182.1 NAD(P)-dependent glycerol-3-phosphate dehydrogenase [Chloroflexota bacterium]MCI0789300.1 NAD(P)-dependent glycerol-3-phosphate dehydrogenase [Chloroflexota bacterium]MCI0848724.1 NAD(P)-dependent glycerol-3-phosphate dehydrogenase [Chloroflexota bacterium]
MSDQAAIIGATTWGTTLGILLAQNNVPVTLLARTESEAQTLSSQRRNARFLPDTPFPDGLSVTSQPESALEHSDLVIIAVPSDRLRENVQRIKPHLQAGAIVLSATKGLELPRARRMSQVLEDELPAGFHPDICVLSGPNLAKEIMQGKPASTVIAGRNPDAAQKAQNTLMSKNFRVYTSADVLGVELAGALKNIVALGAGIGDGMDAGENAKAAFITRGLAEMTRLGIAAGADPMTFAGLAGLGDVVATCSSRLSRNRYVGEQLAKGRSWPEIRDSMDNVAEGVNATQAALMLAQELDVEMPITEMASRVLFDGLSPQEAMAELMSRPARSEW